MDTPRFTMRFRGTHAGFARAFTRLRGALDREPVDAAARYNVELVFEEIVANIIGHGAAHGHEPRVRVAMATDADSIVLTFDDDGVAFDPRAHREPPPRPASLEDAQVGGFGLMLVHRAASALDYERTAEGRNRLTVRLRRKLGTE
jgi:anti-sigma regulatory factor (Ser/Thr protein kinase)